MQSKLLNKVDINGAKKRIKRPGLTTLFPVKIRKEKYLRNEVIRRAYQEYAYTMSEIADAAQLHFSTVSKVIKAGEEAS
jgi:hypothetical protein